MLAVLDAKELAVFERALDKLTEAAERIAATRPVDAKADRRRGGARRVER
ncbi:hypothetical protein HK414_00085 [Ramlibacter terrae]|uniref:MarR family transcriptional regulator n=1 Tax=Ramlibacter terrae TaxID=2732511 RepID=A0ABX6P2J1_9BURK|nr:hypothetical protein HK414_00085 [Ramlibacter terrae]